MISVAKNVAFSSTKGTQSISGTGSIMNYSLLRWITVSGGNGAKYMEIHNSMGNIWLTGGKYHHMECMAKHGINRVLE